MYLSQPQGNYHIGQMSKFFSIPVFACMIIFAVIVETVKHFGLVLKCAIAANKFDWM